MKSYLLTLILILSVSGCKNQMARHFGGTQKVYLYAGEELITATWKENNLWLLIKKKDGSIQMRESSNYGLMEGTVQFERIDR